MTIPIPDSAWTVSGGGPVVFSQAPPGSLPNLPVGVSDAVVPVSGSIVVKPQLSGLRLVLDCQPGTTEPPFTTFAPAAASPFAALEADAPVAAVTAPALTIPPRSKPSFASTKLKVRAGRADVAIACTKGASSCIGRVTLKSASAVRVGGRTRVLQVAPGVSYSVPPGQTQDAEGQAQRRREEAARVAPHAEGPGHPAAGGGARGQAGADGEPMIARRLCL